MKEPDERTLYGFCFNLKTGEFCLDRCRCRYWSAKVPRLELCAKRRAIHSELDLAESVILGGFERVPYQIQIEARHGRWSLPPFDWLGMSRRLDWKIRRQASIPVKKRNASMMGSIAFLERRKRLFENAWVRPPFLEMAALFGLRS